MADFYSCFEVGALGRILLFVGRPRQISSSLELSHSEFIVLLIGGGLGRFLIF